MSKIALLTDLHFGVRNSSDIFIDHKKQFFQTIFFPYLKEHGIKNILILGDFFDHRKYVNFKALYSIRKNFLDTIRKEGIKVHLIPGNHDTFYRSTNDLCSLKETLGYFIDEVEIVMEPSVIDFYGMKIGLIPWINPSNYVSTIDFIENTCDASWLAGHFDIAGFDLFKGMPNKGGMNPSLFERYEQVLSGHFHTRSDKGNILYLGTPYELNWSDCQDPKYFHILDTQTREMEAVRNPLVLHIKIHYNDDENDYSTYPVEDLKNKFIKIIVVKKNDPYLFDKFIEQIKDYHDLKIIEDYSYLDGINVNIGEDSEIIDIESTPDLINSYIDNLKTGDDSIDKERLKTFLLGLYREALTMEIS